MTTSWTDAPDLSFRISLWISTTTWESHGKHSTPLPLAPRLLATTTHDHDPLTFMATPLTRGQEFRLALYL